MLPSVKTEQIMLPSLFDGIYCLVSQIEDVLEQNGNLFQDEVLLSETMPDFRKKEFLAGRILSRIALNHLNISSSSIPHDEHGCSLFPEGSIGSISHSRKIIAVAVASSKKYHGIGIDIEQIGRIKENVFQRIATQKENDMISPISGESQQIQKTIVFSAKEAFYKFQFPLTKQYVNWKDISVIPQNDGNITIQYENKTISSKVTSKPLLAYFSQRNQTIFTLCAQKL